MKIKFIKRDNIAILISIAALLVSSLNYIHNIKKPILFIEGTAKHYYEMNAQSKEVTFKHNQLIFYLHNKGKGKASNVRLSIYPILDNDSEVYTEPNKAFKKYQNKEALFIVVPVIGPNELLKVHINENKQDSRGYISGDITMHMFEPAYTIYADCDEGTSKTAIIVSDNINISR